MKITSFEDVSAQGYEICFIHSGCGEDADVVILDINTIFVFILFIFIRSFFLFL